MKIFFAGMSIALGLFGLALLSGNAYSAKETLVIAVQPTSTPEKLSAQATELEKFLEQRIGMEVELKFPTSYAGVVEALRFGHAQAAFMSAWPAALAGREAQAEVALAEVRAVSIGVEQKEAPYYYSYWVVLKDSPYQTLSDLKGKRAAFPSQLSTSGYIAPVARLVEMNLLSKQSGSPADPKQFFGEVLFSGGYAQAWEALKARQVDVSVIAGDVPQELYQQVLGQIRILETQGPIPSHAVVFASGLKDPLRQKLQNALMALNEPEHRELMRKFVSGIFVRFEPTDSQTHLASLNRFLELTGMEFEEPSKKP